MKDRMPILLLILWMILPFAGLGAYAYVGFRQMAVSNETNTLLRQVGYIAGRLHAARDPELEAAEWGRLLTQGMLLRWIDAAGRVRAALTSDSELEARGPSFRHLQRPTVVEEHADRIYVMAPVFQGNQQTGVVELGMNWTWLVRQRRSFALGLAAVSCGSLVLTGFVAAVFARMRRETQHERQRRYLADLFHELRTPLTVIESYADMMKRWAGSDPKLREEATAVIAAEASRLRRLATQLLNGQDWDEPESALRIVTFDLDEQLKDVTERLAAAFARTIRVRILRDSHDGGTERMAWGTATGAGHTEDAAATIAAVSAAKALRISGDPEQLQQLWIILLDNALKYSDDPIDIELEEQRDHVTVTVTDRGIGIPQKELPRLFDRHYRGKGVRWLRGGSGLGLSIAGGIVRRHGGTIRIESSQGTGTSAIVTLPKR